MTAGEFRQFFRDLFGSRLVSGLEVQLIQLRADFEERLQDKELVIATLREEKAALIGKVALYEASLLPLTSRAGAEIVKTTKPMKPNFAAWDFNAPPVKSRWQGIVEAHDKELEEEAQAQNQPAQASA